MNNLEHATSSASISKDETETTAGPKSAIPSERRYRCYCCGHSNPAAAFECEKCFVRL